MRCGSNGWQLPPSYKHILCTLMLLMFFFLVRHMMIQNWGRPLGIKVYGAVCSQSNLSVWEVEAMKTWQQEEWITICGNVLKSCKNIGGSVLYILLETGAVLPASTYSIWHPFNASLKLPPIYVLKVLLQYSRQTWSPSSGYSPLDNIQMNTTLNASLLEVRCKSQ